MISAALALALVLWEPSTASPDRPGPQAAIAAATALAEAGDFEAALASVRAARSVEDDPRLIYMEAQLLRLSGDCERAVTQYLAFLETEPPTLDREYAERSIEDCGGTRRPEPPPAVAPEPVPPPAAYGPSEPPTTDPPKPDPSLVTSERQRDRRVAIGLWTGGSLGVVVGAALVGGGFGVRADALDSDLDLQTYRDKERVAVGLSGAGYGVIAAGGAVLVGAIVHHLARRRRARATRR